MGLSFWVTHWIWVFRDTQWVWVVEVWDLSFQDTQTDDSKLYLTSHVSIASWCFLTTDRINWKFQLLNDKIMCWSQNPFWLVLTDVFKFKLANHASVFIRTDSLQTWFQILSDKSCFDVNLGNDIGQMLPNFDWQNHHVLISTSLPPNHASILTSLFTTGRWFQILSNKWWFDLNIFTGNWQMLANFACMLQLIFGLS